jgi:predicted nucleotidyltransferase
MIDNTELSGGWGFKSPHSHSYFLIEVLIKKMDTFFSMTLENIKENLIIEFLKNRYQAEAIIIVGSRAVGDYKPNSDWNIYVFSEEPYPKESHENMRKALAAELKNEDLDIYKNSMYGETFSPKLFRDLRNSKVVLDTKNGFAEKLRKKALAMYKKGPIKWTKVYALGRVYRAKRYIHKFEDSLASTEYEQLFLRIAWHFTEDITEWWFGIRTEFALRSQEAFSYIKKQDPAFYDKLQIVVGEKSTYKQKVEAFREMHNLLFESKQFKELIS